MQRIPDHFCSSSSQEFEFDEEKEEEKDEEKEESESDDRDSDTAYSADSESDLKGDRTISPSDQALTLCRPKIIRRRKRVQAALGPMMSEVEMSLAAKKQRVKSSCTPHRRKRSALHEESCAAESEHEVTDGKCESSEAAVASDRVTQKKRRKMSRQEAHLLSSAFTSFTLEQSAPSDGDDHFSFQQHKRHKFC